jgi:hypothetical protein
MDNYNRKNETDVLYESRGIAVKNIGLTAMVLVLLLAAACAVAGKRNPVNVPVQIQRENLHKASILVLNFKEPDHAKGMGIFAAERFQVNLLQSKKFRVVSLYTSSHWERISDVEEERIINALQEPKARGYDYILLGELKAFYDGGINRSKAGLKVRIIETATQTTVFMAEQFKESTGKDRHYPMNIKLSTRGKHPKMLVELIIRDMLKEI